MIHLLYCPLTGLGLRGGFRGNAWLKNRIRVFNEFVLPSLQNQTKQEFITWISCRPQERYNPIIQNFANNLSGIRGMTFVFTYEGLCFWDDKTPDKLEHARLLERLTRTLPELEPYIGKEEHVYMTIQPSDDMYLSTAIETIQSVPFEERRSIGWVEGYIMNYATKEVAEYNPTTLPPFSTIMFPRETFLNPFAHFNYTGPYVSHEYVKVHTKFLAIPGRGFVVGTHGENISTTFNHPYKGRILTPEERDDVLIKTGTFFSDPVVINKGLRLKARQVLNRIPFQSNLRELYHKLPPSLQWF